MEIEKYIRHNDYHASDLEEARYTAINAAQAFENLINLLLRKEIITEDEVKSDILMGFSEY